MNQVLLRSINTTLASALPVLSLLLIGAGLFGQVTLREFAIALLVGMLTGAYSSIFVASPLLGWLKARSPPFAGRRAGAGDHLVGEDLRAVVIAGPAACARRPAGAGAAAATAGRAPPTAATDGDRPRGAAARRLGAADRLLTPPAAPAQEEAALSRRPVDGSRPPSGGSRL